MLETRATVIRLEGAQAIVEAEQGGGCGACSGGACGSSRLSEMLCVRPREFKVRNDINARVGDRVQVAVADGLLLRSALTLYGLPLLFLFAGALSGMRWLGGDGGAVGGAAAGLLAGFALARFLTARQRAAIPAIVRCEDTKKSAIL